MEKEKNELEEIAREMRNADYEYLKETMGPLKEILPKDAVIKENDFKTYFLPLINGSIEINEENMNRFRHNIIQLTGSYKLGFAVYTDDMSELLFKLPPLILDVDKDGIAKEVNFSKLGNMYREMSTGSNNSHADKFLKSSFEGLGKILVPNKDEEFFYENEIIKIFKRYGIKPSTERDKEDKSVENENTDNKKIGKLEDDEYDDLFDYE